MKRPLLLAAGLVLLAAWAASASMPDRGLPPSCQPRIDEATGCRDGRSPRPSPPALGAAEVPYDRPPRAEGQPSPASIDAGPVSGGAEAGLAPAAQPVSSTLVTRRIAWRQLQ